MKRSVLYKSNHSYPLTYPRFQYQKNSLPQTDFTMMTFRSFATCLLTASLALLAVSCSKTDVDSTPDYPLGAFNFDFARLGETVADQFDALEAMGYKGITMGVNNDKQIEQLENYKQNLEGRDLTFWAAFYVARLDNELSETYAHIDKVLASVAPTGGSFWLIIFETEKGRGDVLSFINTVADKAKAAGVEFVLYPHDNCEAETAEEMLSYVQELGRDDIYISLHFCHEFRGGNTDRLTEVAQAIKPYLRLPSINGADADSVTDGRKEGWDRSIRPLDKGDADASKLLEALKAVGYEGPVVLHTFGLQKVEADHHQRSMTTYKQMLEEL